MVTFSPRRRCRNWHALGLLAVFCLGLSLPARADSPPDDPRVTPVVRAFRKAGPAVVNISSQRVVARQWGLFGRDPFEDIFPFRMSPTRKVPVVSLGSGVLIDPAGYIVTNAHVVRKAQSITVGLQDKQTFNARVISADLGSDLAILKIDPPENTKLSYLPLGRSDDLMIGETVIAVGNPLGYTSTVSTGVVSAVGRELTFADEITYTGLIQTDAPINQGNSGGPLLNIKGELIGINTAIRADAQNIGFAIGVDTLREKLPELVDFERLNRVRFGARVRQRPLGAGGDVYVLRVTEDSPAHGKLRIGDEILAVNGRDVRHVTDFIFAMIDVDAGETVDLRCDRNGREVEVQVAVESKPRPDGRALAQQWMGVRLREITPQLAEDLRLATDRGLLVVAVDDASPAARLGIRPKDILFHIAGSHVEELETLGLLLEDAGGGEWVRLGIVRGNTAAMVRMRLREKPAPRKDESQEEGSPSGTPVSEEPAGAIPAGNAVRI